MFAKDLIRHFNLFPHPEGGYYIQTYQANEKIKRLCLPERFTGDRFYSSAIYFLLEEGDFSGFHRIKSDECWHFYAGQALNIFIIHPDGELQIIKLGNQTDRGEVFQFVVPAGAWFASQPAPGSTYSFVGCTVSPGFDFEDFELAKKSELIEIFPDHSGIIEKLCRE